MSKPIDYSKWDKIDWSDDEDEEYDNIRPSSLNSIWQGVEPTITGADHKSPGATTRTNTHDERVDVPYGSYVAVKDSNKEMTTISKATLSACPGPQCCGTTMGRYYDKFNGVCDSICMDVNMFHVATNGDPRHCILIGPGDCDWEQNLQQMEYIKEISRSLAIPNLRIDLQLHLKELSTKMTGGIGWGDGRPEGDKLYMEQIAGMAVMDSYADKTKKESKPLVFDTREDNTAAIRDYVNTTLDEWADGLGFD